MPPPPRGNRSVTEPIEKPKEAEPVDTAKLTDNETYFIMKQTLRPDQIGSPSIIRFILAYMESRSAPQAAEEAGYPRGKGSYLRSRPEIHACIERLTAKAVMKHGYDESEIIERVKEISFLDPIEFENPDGSFKTHMSQIRPEARRAIKKFRVKNLYGEDPNGMKIVIGQIIDVELWDKLKAAELLGGEKDVFKKTTKVEHDVTSRMADVLLGSQRRAEARIAQAKQVIEIEGKTYESQQVEQDRVAEQEVGVPGEPDSGGS